MNELTKLLESTALKELDSTLREALLEAWEETKRETEEKVRKELTERYEHDKAQLVESMDKFFSEVLEKELSNFEKTKKELKENYEKSLVEMSKKVDSAKEIVKESLKKEMEEIAEEKKRLAEQRVALQRKIMEAKKEVKEQFASQAKLLENFVKENLEKEIKEFVEDKKKMEEEYAEMKNKMIARERKLKEAYAKRIMALEEFVVSNLEKELREFHEDKKLLERRRVELEVNATKKLNEAKKAFIERAAASIDKTVSSHLEKELRQLREDLKVARENNFGRRIFEAFAHEYMASYLSEGSKVKELMKELNETREKLNETIKELNRREKLVESVERKAKLLEDRLNREKIIQKLVSPLSSTQKKTMINLLEGVETSKLEATFHKYLDAVLQETAKSSNRDYDKTSKEKESLFETVENEEHSFVTGDKKVMIVEENDEDQYDSTIIEIKKLAGINK